MLRDLLAAATGLVAPPACAACGGPPGGAGLCAACRGAMPWLWVTCPRCALPACRTRCPAAGAAFTASWAPLGHEGPARELVARLKFRGAVPAGQALAAAMAARLPDVLARDAVLVPVPGDPLRRRARGVDHAALLASLVARRTGLPAAAVLRRARPVRTQRAAGRAARRAGPAAGLRVQGPVPPVVLLVDDVHTTGGTLDVAARALLAAGAVEVRAVTATRTLRW